MKPKSYYLIKIYGMIAIVKLVTQYEDEYRFGRLGKIFKYSDTWDYKTGNQIYFEKDKILNSSDNLDELKEQAMLDIL